jgi:hypothetical protein
MLIERQFPPPLGSYTMPLGEDGPIVHLLQ